jgi:hypothetical protein
VSTPAVVTTGMKRAGASAPPPASAEERKSAIVTVTDRKLAKRLRQEQL